ncbi:hypothetical protein FQN49_005892 [Arthroderma sp. PD_2]|nr:hypothetical protein FQN49_005892 [Arthroderma sp. PD_2]
MEPFSRRPIYSPSEDKVVKYINEVLVLILEQLSKPDGHPSISLKRRSTHGTYAINLETGALESSEGANTCTYTWPGKTAQEAWRFGVLTRILGLISEAIDGNFISSKRDLFYQDPVYFGSQKLVDRYVMILPSQSGSTGRRYMWYAAAAKGMIGGSFRVRLKGGSLIQVDACTEGVTVPRIDEIERVDISGISWVLVIEKEVGSLSSFGDIWLSQYICGWERNTLNHGMAIMSTYKYGSMAQVHQNAKLNVHAIQWIGLQASEMISTVDGPNRSSLIPMSQRDRKKSEAMLKQNPSFAEDGPEPTWRRELQSLLMVNMKAEIEVLYQLDGGIEGWLDKKLSREEN